LGAENIIGMLRACFKSSENAEIRALRLDTAPERSYFHNFFYGYRGNTSLNLVVFAEEKR